MGEQIDNMSVLIICKNERLHIARCVATVVEHFSDVVVLDSSSEDGSAALAEAAGARVVDFRWNGGYPKKKQWGLDNAGLLHDWVLLLDGDEYVTSELIAEIRNRAGREDQAIAAYDVPLDYVFMGRHMRHGHQVSKRIVFKRSAAAFPVLDDLGVENPMEMELHVQPAAAPGFRVGRFASRLAHEDLEPLVHWFDRHNRYSDWEAHLRTRAVKSVRTRKGMVWAAVPFKPVVFFVYCYLLRQGFRDGRPGLHYAVAQSFYYWQISVKTEEATAARVR